MGSTATTLAALLLLVTVPAFAEHGSGGGDSVAGTSTSTSNDAKTTAERHSGMLASRDMATTAKTETGNEATTSGADNQSGSMDMHERGAKILADAKKNHKSEKSADAKKKSCETHKQGLETKFTHISANSQKIQSKIDGILVKAQDYKTTNNIVLANYDELLSAATSAQADLSSINRRAKSSSANC